MLDQTTKRKLDSARQILVGKVPEPKAQVEQITTALVYKFMDDMDKESEELGGETKFFSNEFSQYTWTKLLDNKLSGQQRLDLYVQAITSMSKNPHIPQLFRDIFKGAFLPYNDPRTLSLFLKEINEFNYEHSENLGNAFEYLLSILGSQGDAGQFRTPRHIIDFIVEVVDPKKNETILDPACGTAGFLISAYKHILKTNKEKPLTPDEKLKLMNNLAGYDISPDMVKLALVNMYLHGFPEPKIHEYDTLSSEKRWDEAFDVILANPPFMTPKGGIVPHKKFSVSANRAEVLFVDYIAEHLTLKGRAGIIVPEGIIFQSANAYKSLRKNLIENWGLYAVVSLPSGVFQPYSGVKTSILLLDRQLAKTQEKILFVRVDNDGFGLGAQRREIEQNDLPETLQIIKDFKNGKIQIEGEKIILATKKELADNDYNLTAERYRSEEEILNQKWPMVELGEVCEIKRGTSITKKDLIIGKIPVIAGGQQPAYYHNVPNRDGKTITVSASGAYAGFINFFKMPIFASDCSTIQIKNIDIALIEFIFYVLKSKQRDIYKLQSGMGQPHVYAKDLQKLKIPLPPLEVQKQIVAEIEVKQTAINQAKELIKTLEREREYFGKSLEKIENLEWVELGEEVSIVKAVCKIQKTQFNDFGKFPIIDQSQIFISGYTNNENAVLYSKKDLIIFGDHTCVIKYVNFPFAQGADGIKILKPSSKLLSRFLYFFLIANPIESDGYKRHFAKLKLCRIPLPSLEIQKQLVAQVEKEEEIIKANKELIKIMEEKINEVISGII